MQGRRMEKLPQAPGNVTDVLKVLIFGHNDVQPIIDGSTDELVGIDVLKDNGVLLCITGLDISEVDILNMKKIYNKYIEILEYNIVWIPIVEQLTHKLQEKFQMLRSRMPWYVVQYFLPLVSIKFIKEEWHFENDPIAVAINAQGNVVARGALDVFRMDKGEVCRPSIIMLLVAEHPFSRLPVGPHSIEEYTLLLGGKDRGWIAHLSSTVNVVANDPIITSAHIFIESSVVEKGCNWKIWGTSSKTRKRNQEIQRLLPSFQNEFRWAVFTKWGTKIVGDNGPKILMVLEWFEEWKHHVPRRGFENCFKDYYAKLRPTGYAFPSMGYTNPSQYRIS